MGSVPNTGICSLVFVCVCVCQVEMSNGRGVRFGGQCMEKFTSLKCRVRYRVRHPRHTVSWGPGFPELQMKESEEWAPVPCRASGHGLCSCDVKWRYQSLFLTARRRDSCSNERMLLKYSEYRRGFISSQLVLRVGTKERRIWNSQVVKELGQFQQLYF